AQAVVQTEVGDGRGGGRHFRPRLGQAGALREAAGPALSWEWLDAGRIQARAAAARAGQEAALNAFEQTVLTALQDSEIALRQ
ncbi:hypothetical protein, partial [Klebsiella pneumoniae]|uniref:hypothetical protein n=1 Tax=Klebsiella pneumoniae TaxID=573 RepID=UPI00275B90BE|nr:hypothetical protein [Klebsiella pneumoniae]